MSYQTIGFIGLGNMGLPMARNMAVAGFTVNGYDPNVAPAEAVVDAGLVLHQQLSDAVAGADLIITMLPNGDVVLDVLQQIINGGSKPQAMVDCSTIDISDARKAHALAEQAAIPFLDVPVSGGIAGAAAGTLTGMVGGSAALLESLMPTLDPLFKAMVHCGDGGAGQAAKICNNMLLATSMIGTAETFNLGRKLGLDMATLFSVLSGSTGSCWSVNNYCPVPGVGPVSPADNDYKPGFSARMMLKDMNLTQNAAESVAQATPLGAHALALYADFVAKGGAEDDFSAIIRYLATLER